MLMVALTCLGIFWHYSRSQIPLLSWLKLVDDFFIKYGIYDKRGVALDAYIAGVCWGATNLFVRRLWNPETALSCLKRFSGDAIFGGVAAGLAVILRQYYAKQFSS